MSLKKSKIRVVMMILFLFVGNLVVASPSSRDDGVIYQEIKLLVDSTQSLNIQQVETMESEAITSSQEFIVPSVENDYWFIIKCKNIDNSQVNQHIGFDITCLEEVDLYYKDSTTWIHKENGLSIPISEREIYSRLPGHHVLFEPNEEKTIYLHMRSKYLVPTSIENKTESSFLVSDNKSLFAHWFYVGAAVSILLYNLLLLIQLKDKIYLYYILYVLCLLCWVFLDSGIFLYFSSNMELYYFLSIGAPTMGGFLTLFTREMLKVKYMSKWMDKVLIGISLSYFLIAVLVGFDVHYYQFLGVIAMPFTLFLLFVGIYGLYKKVPLSPFYVIASSLYLLGLFSYAGLTLGLVPYNPITRYGYIGGSFFELIVFSLALGFRVKLLQAEKLKYQKTIIENERTMTRRLESKVKERTEELQIATEKLQESNNAKDKLFSIISHDLRGPVGAIMGLMELYKRNYESYDVDKRNKLIDRVSESTVKTFRMLENLLFWARNQTDGIKVKAVKFDVVQMIEDVIQVLENQARDKNISFIVPDIKKYVFADSEMIKVVIRNLISNAIKFTKNGGDILVTVTDYSENELLIGVKDSGVGISEEKQRNLFTLGSGSSMGTDKEKGTGLGLVLCKELVEKHGGKIWVNSKINEGSIFSFTIPNE